MLVHATLMMTSHHKLMQYKFCKSFIINSKKWITINNITWFITLCRHSDVCKKCRTNSSEIILRKKDGYCTSCFLINTTHKFRAALGKSKIIHRGDTILIGYCGRENSTALLHLIKSGMSETTHKKIIFNVVIFFIDGKIFSFLT